MGKPAARQTDMTAHGGTITVGCPTVLIGGLPAARVGDMHVCPFVTPTPVPVPHVGGPIMPPGAVTVLIGGLPAACVGDMATCTGPPAPILPPGCPTVLIGPGGGGGGGGGMARSGAQAAVSGAVAAVVQAVDGAGEDADEEPEEEHYLDVKVVDQGGFPVSGIKYKLKAPNGAESEGLVYGSIKRTGVEEGDYDIALSAIQDARWGAKEAAIGDKVKMTVTTAGIENGEKAVLKIYIKDASFADHLFETITTEVDSDKVEDEWELEIDQDLIERQDKKATRGYSAPYYFFVAEIAGLRQRSGLLKFKDWMEINLEDDDGSKLGSQKYRVYLPNGEVREGDLDSDGYAKVENIPPGRVEVEFPEIYDDEEEDEDAAEEGGEVSSGSQAPAGASGSQAPVSGAGTQAPAGPSGTQAPASQPASQSPPATPGSQVPTGSPSPQRPAAPGDEADSSQADDGDDSPQRR